MSLIELKGVSVAYDDADVLSGVNLCVDEGDFIGIIGPNGGGKTTLVKAMLGQVDYRGQISYSPEVKTNSGLAIGYLPQQNLYHRQVRLSSHLQFQYQRL